MSTMIDDGPPPLSTEELRRLAEREKNAQDKRQQRARNATERAVAALVLAGTADPDGVRELVRLDPDLPQHARQSLE